jgi:bifunctional DNA-binding transcriptional regulator/antitoxin component of YhaV-PrlF toxin-antitoxin module
MPIPHYHGNIRLMASLSKITAQGQTSVPLAVRKKLGIGPGSVLEWDNEGESVVVRRAGRYTSEDIHRALFPRGKPRRRTLKQLKKGIEQNIKKRHARS